VQVRGRAASTPEGRAIDLDVSTSRPSQRPVSPTASTEPSEFAAWHTVPSFAIVATEDNAIGVANERVMA
jgi:hypothetical protein